jgi:hypothetical protein
MAIKKRSINSQGQQTDYKHLVSTFNQSSPNNPSHLSNLPTNYDIKTITLEDCDRAVFEEFNKRFKIGEKFMPIILLDTELTAFQMQTQYTEQYDIDKGFLNGPYFTMFRTKSIPKFRTNATYKPVIYTIPKMKANGMVYEEWIAPGPLSYDLIYEFKFLTNYREYTNEFESQMRKYFGNKRNIIICNNERFSFGPQEQDVLAELEIVNREEVEERTLYVLTFTLKLECFTRDMSDVQKRERPNKYTLDISVQEGNTVYKDSTIEILADRIDIDIEPYPFGHGDIQDPSSTPNP